MNYPSNQVPLNIVAPKVLRGHDPVPSIPGHQIVYIAAISQTPVPADGAFSRVLYYGHGGERKSVRCTDTVSTLTTALSTSIPLTLTEPIDGFDAGDIINVNTAHIAEPLISKPTGVGSHVWIRHDMQEDPIKIIVDETKATIQVAINTAITTAQVWTKITVDIDTAFTAAAGVEDIELFSLAAKSRLAGVFQKHSVSVSGGGVGSASTEVGINGDLTKYNGSFDVFQAVGDQVFQMGENAEQSPEDWGSPTSIRLNLAADVNVADITAGTVDVYVRVEVIE